MEVGLPEGEKGQVFLQIGGETLVCRAVEVNGKRGEGDEKVGGKALGAESAVFFAHDASRKTQGTVKEGIPQSAAVRLCVQAGIISVREGGILL